MKHEYYYMFNNVILDTKEKAEEVLSLMKEVLTRYRNISIADMYELAGKPCTYYKEHKYGWTDLSKTKIVSVKDGYKIKMPKAIPLD